MPEQISPAGVSQPRGAGWKARLPLVVAALTVAVLAISVPGALRYASEHGGVYLFSEAFLEDLPKRLTGPGRLRFVIQPLLAMLLGWRLGRADARAGRPPFLSGLLFHAAHRRELARSSFQGIVVLLLMGILMDSVFQWALFGISYPVVALVVGPLLIAFPFTLSRSLASSISRGRPASERSASHDK